MRSSTAELACSRSLREHPVVPGDTEEPEADNAETGHRARPERHLEAGLRPSRAASAVRTFERTARVHADEPRRGREHGADQESDCRPPPSFLYSPSRRNGTMATTAIVVY